MTRKIHTCAPLTFVFKHSDIHVAGLLRVQQSTCRLFVCGRPGVKIEQCCRNNKPCWIAGDANVLLIDVIFDATPGWTRRHAWPFHALAIHKNKYALCCCYRPLGGTCAFNEIPVCYCVVFTYDSLIKFLNDELMLSLISSVHFVRNTSNIYVLCVIPSRSRTNEIFVLIFGGDESLIGVL